MARIFGPYIGKKRTLSHARASELRGELAQAAVLFAQAGRLDEAARVMVLRGDAEADPAARLVHYVQAVATAPLDSSVRFHARSKRAYTVVAMAGNSPTTQALRQDLTEAASELEAIGDHVSAARAYAIAGDLEGQARALARAGDVEGLDVLLGEEQSRDRETIVRRHAHDDFAVLVASGRRREAAAMGRASADEVLRERARDIARRRITGSVVDAALRGKEIAIALGDEILIGRAPAHPSSVRSPGQPGGSDEAVSALIGSIRVASAAVSRKHVTVARRGKDIVVRDLGSRNGTTLRGLALSGEAPVGDGIELRLGREVPLLVRPTSELHGAVAIEVAGVRYVAPLGPAMLGVGRWRLESSDDGWIELVTDDDPHAFAGSLQLAMRVTLLVGDAITMERDGVPVLEARERGR
jgi:hypothetical protein